MRPVIRSIKPTEKSVAQVAFEKGKAEGELALANAITAGPVPYLHEPVCHTTPRQGDVSVTYSYDVQYVQDPYSQDGPVEVSVRRRDRYGETEWLHRARLPRRGFHAPTREDIDESITYIVRDVARNMPCDAVALVWAVVPMLYRLVHPNPHSTEDGYISSHCMYLVRSILYRLYDTDTAELFMSRQ